MADKNSKKVILSRKGFDSAAGGNASMIIEVGSNDYVIQPLPIPDIIGNNEYSKLKDVLGKENLLASMEKAGITPKIKKKVEEGSDNKLKMVDETKCHLDPDIFKDGLGAFGQMNASESHLCGNGVGVGDIFLFFGWYKYYKSEAEKFVKIEERPSGGEHVLYGYLIVDEVYDLTKDDELKKACEKYGKHPHCVKQLDLEEQISHNRLYVSTNNIEELGIPGFGIFKYSDDLVLSKKGMTKSKWSLEAKFMKMLDEASCDITYHNDENWHREKGYFQSVARGQEFVITSDSDKFYDEVVAFIKEHV